MKDRQYKTVRETGRKILVVDGEQIIVDLLKRVLTREGYDVSTVLRCDDAVVEACRRAYDLAIADVDLYRSDGRELMRMLGEASPDTAIVIMTTNAEQGLVHFAREHAHGVLQKPFALEELLTTVRTALNLRVKSSRRREVVRALSARLRAGAQA